MDHRRKYCKTKFVFDELAIQECELSYNYCQLCCNDMIPLNENILNYSCWKDCVTVSSSDSQFPSCQPPYPNLGS